MSLPAPRAKSPAASFAASLPTNETPGERDRSPRLLVVP
jgi:hypothetical protein